MLPTSRHVLRSVLRPLPFPLLRNPGKAGLSFGFSRRKQGTELHAKPPAVVEPLRTVDSVYEDVSRIAYEDWVQHHPVYSQEELKSVKVVSHEINDFSDRVADWIVRFCRWGTDYATNYTHRSPAEIKAEQRKLGRQMTVPEMRQRRLIMTPEEWLLRTLFLESIAGVPGMVGGILRHLRSLRLLKRDGGWIHTLLSEAENERMHLLCFLTVKQPGRLFRFLVMGAQGIFTNILFLLYLISPRSVHRFVQRLEVEAVYTYTLLIEEIESGRFPEWASMKAPQIAVDYWRLPPANRTMLDMIYNIRADEATHRFVNGTLANMHPADINPFGLSEPGAAVRGSRAEYTRDEALQWLTENSEIAKRKHLDHPPTSPDTPMK